MSLALPHKPTKTYNIPTALLRHKTPKIFETSICTRSKRDCYEIRHIDPDVFEPFIQWLYLGALVIPDLPVVYPGVESRQMRVRVQLAIDCYHFGVQIKCSAFKNASLKAVRAMLPSHETLFFRSSDLRIHGEAGVKRDLAFSSTLSKMASNSGMWRFLMERELYALELMPNGHQAIQVLKDVLEAHECRDGDEPEPIDMDEFLD
jgi:hypothetical protein